MTRLKEIVESLRTGFFFVPLLIVIAAIALAELTLLIERSGIDPPLFFQSTVANARSILGTVAGATITVAGIVFSIYVLTIQLAARQFSPRALYVLYRDPFSKQVLGIVAGTFTFALVVLRSVREPEGRADGFIPAISVNLALLLGVVSILAIIGFIHHTAKTMQVSQIIRQIAEETQGCVMRLTKERGAWEEETGPQPVPRGEPLVVRAHHDGWVQQIDIHKLYKAAPQAGVVRLETRVGAYVTEETPICTVWPKPEDHDGSTDRIVDSIRLGEQRTLQQDLGFGMRQLVDIALRALSPGVNDPTTAEEVIVHLGSILRPLLLRDLPPPVRRGPDGRWLLALKEPSDGDYIALAFDQIRIAAAGHPTVCTTMLDTIGMLLEALERRDEDGRAEILRAHARRILVTCPSGAMIADDAAAVRAAAARIGI